MTNIIPLPTAKPELTFDDFWRVYPRRVGKLAALRAWQKAIRLAPAEEIIEAAGRYARVAEMPYTCHPTTWLNQGRWMDEYCADQVVTSGKSTIAKHHAKLIREGKRHLIPFTSDSEVREMVRDGLLTAEEARKAGYSV